MEVIEMEYKGRGKKIFVHPPSAKVSIENGVFKLTERLLSEKINRTIDYFFKSAAADFKNQVIEIIMSGTGSDGTQGFHAIEDEGGISITQDPKTAEFDGMPLSSIQFDHPSYVLHPVEMPSKIQQIVLNQLEPNK